MPSPALSDRSSIPNGHDAAQAPSLGRPAGQAASSRWPPR
jgi:hypothetical protein